MKYLLKALALALILSAPLYPAACMLLDDTVELGCMTDTECMLQHGGDGGLD